MSEHISRGSKVTTQVSSSGGMTYLNIEPEAGFRMEGADYNAAERRQARKDNTKIVKNSGRGMNKGDAETDKLLIDYKFTEAKSFALALDKFKKHEQDAVRASKIPVVVAIFQSYNDRAIAMVDWDDLRELLLRIEELENDKI